MHEITINEADLAALARSRALALGQFGGLDNKRPTSWDQYGWKERLQFADYLQAYERGGAAFGAVHRILDRCWQDPPRIKSPESDEETPQEKKLARELKRLKLWQKFIDFDRRNLVGHYAGLIYRVADGLDLREPLGRGKLVDVVPVYEDQLRVTLWNSDTASPDYGKPLMWQYRARRVESNATQAQAAPEQWVDVHPSRLQILAEGCAGDDFTQGVPLLRAGFNALVDIEKISGGSGESFLKNSARTVVLKFDANSSPQALTTNPDGTPSGKTVAAAIEEKVDALNRSIDKSIVLQGGEATTLQTQMTDPKPAFEVAANLFSASVLVPFTILFGQQTGRLASDQDQKDLNARCHARRCNVLTPAIEEFIARGQAAGWFDEGEFDVEWPALDSPTDEAKADLADKMAATNERAMKYGGQPVYSQQEIRRAGGYKEPLDEEALPLPGEVDPMADPGADPGADPTAGGVPPTVRRVA